MKVSSGAKGKQHLLVMTWGSTALGVTQARSTTVVTPIVQTSQLPPGADLPINPDDVAWGALEGEADESQIILQQLITMLQRNATNTNPVDITEARRTLEQSASKGSTAAQTALRILKPTFYNVPESL